MRWWLIASLLVGCEGERVDSVGAPDAGPPADTAGSTCDDIPGNLVPNPSFEELVGTNVASWTDGNLVSVTGGADHCERYAKVTDAPAWSGVSERIAVTAGAGDTLEYGMSLQVLDGDYTEVGLFLVSPDDTQTSRLIRAMPREQKWVRVAGSLKLTAPITEMVIGFGTNVPKTRSLAVDRVWLIKK